MASVALHRTVMLHVGISSWIVQDGNYGDFAVGENRRFALEFHSPAGLRRSLEGSKTAQHLGASRYRIHAEIVFIQQGLWVIDAGLFVAFEERQPPSEARIGGWIEGDIYLGIDPFFYFEYLHRIEGMPPLTYTWIVQAIMLETTPWVERSEQGRQYRMRDETKESFIPVLKTKAWEDDGGNGHYVLGCEMLGGPERPVQS